MSFEPQKFFIGLMDFFSIVLPGALLTYLLMGQVGPMVLGSKGFQEVAQIKGAGWVAFLVASYVVGHLIFLLGSWLDELYDRLRRHTLNSQIALLARRGQLLAWPIRALVWLVFKSEADDAVQRAARIKKQTLAPLCAQDSVNAFQWCKALLNTEAPASLAVVERFEADSKFFRSFAVLLILLLTTWHWHQLWPRKGIPAVGVLLLLTLWRYMEQRYKATNQAYWAIITLTAKAGKVAFEKAAPLDASSTHAGGVVFRIRRSNAQYLLVQAKDDPDQWVLPKGHIEELENPRETAVREVLEETGTWARIEAQLRNVSYTVNGATIAIKFYLMRAVGRGARKDANREHVWLRLEQAVARASYMEARELLRSADRHRVRTSVSANGGTFITSVRKPSGAGGIEQHVA